MVRREVFVEVLLGRRPLDGDVGHAREKRADRIQTARLLLKARFDQSKSALDLAEALKNLFRGPRPDCGRWVSMRQRDIEQGVQRDSRPHTLALCPHAE